MQNELITKVCESIVNQLGNTADRRLKIHPTAESLENCKEILSTIKPPVEVIQKADLLFLVNTSDIIISFGNSSELFEPLLNKPAYIMNPLNEDASKNLYPKENIVIECRTVDDLIKKLEIPRRLELVLTASSLSLRSRCTCSMEKRIERAAKHIISLLGNRINISRHS